MKPKDWNCAECPYRTLEEVDDRIPCPPDVEENGKKYWESCDCDRIVLDAAELLENMKDNILTQAAELLAPKMLCVKCGLGCGQYERKNMCSAQVKNWLKENMDDDSKRDIG